MDRIGIFEDQVFSGDGDFKWKIGKIKQSDVLLLGCEFSIWGDIGYALFKSLFKTEIKNSFMLVNSAHWIEIRCQIRLLELVQAVI